MLIKSGYKNILLNINPDDISSIYMKDIYPGQFAILVHSFSDGQEDPGIEVGRYHSEETAQRNYDGLIKFFQSMIGHEQIKQSEIFYMTPNDWHKGD